MTKNPPEYHSHFSVDVNLPPASSKWFWPPSHFPGHDVIVEILDLVARASVGLRRLCLDDCSKNIMQTASITVVLFTIASFGMGSAAGLGPMGSLFTVRVKE